MLILLSLLLQRNGILKYRYGILDWSHIISFKFPCPVQVIYFAVRIPSGFLHLFLLFYWRVESFFGSFRLFIATYISCYAILCLFFAFCHTNREVNFCNFPEQKLKILNQIFEFLNFFKLNRRLYAHCWKIRYCSPTGNQYIRFHRVHSTYPPKY